MSGVEYKFYKENHYKKTVTKETTSQHHRLTVPSSTRNPLSTLSDNVPLNQNVAVTKSTTTYKKKIDTREKIFRSKSTSTVSTKLDFYEKEETRNRNEAISKKPSAQVPPVTRKPVKKVTLIKKLSVRSGKKPTQMEELFADSLYDVEYFSVNYNYMAETDKKFILKRNHLLEHIDVNYRTLTVNWLISVQEILRLSEVTFFTTIRLIDAFLIQTKISVKIYDLIGLACIWIASKMHDSYFILAPRLVALCCGKYSTKEIISMERNILKTLQFNVNFPEPSTYLYYHLKQSNLEKNAKVLFGTMFILEIFTFLNIYSSYSPSLLAATALYLTLQRLGMECDGFLELHDFDEPERFKAFVKYMNYCSRQILNTKCLANEVVAKYSKQDKLNVFQYFSRE